MSCCRLRVGVHSLGANHGHPLDTAGTGLRFCRVILHDKGDEVRFGIALEMRQIAAIKGHIEVRQPTLIPTEIMEYILS